MYQLDTGAGTQSLDPMSMKGRTHAAVIEATMERRHSCAAFRSSQETRQQASYAAASNSPLRQPHPPPSASMSYGSGSQTYSYQDTSSRGAYSHLPELQRDIINLEPDCIPWTDLGPSTPLQWLSSKLFVSKVELKARNPPDCNAIGYEMRAQTPLTGFVWRFLGFMCYCVLIATFHDGLGIPCTGTQDTPQHALPSSGIPGRSLVLIWSEALVTAGACFLIAQGYYGVRATRERMERVRQTAVTLAYSFLKTTSADIGGGHGKDELQGLIYECLALLTAFPVALLHQVQGNTCEPAVTRYCQEVSKKLKRLRNGQDSIGWSPHDVAVNEGHSHRNFVTVEFFFELFSLHLETEYRRQTVKTKIPSMAPQYIIYNLRNHFENIVDMGNLDDRRTPIVRENIDMLALAGRECGIFSYADVAPVAFIWAVDLCGRALAFGSPVQNCEWLVNSTESHIYGVKIPRTGAFFSWIGSSLISATILTILAEMWWLWDPFGKAINTFAWSLGIATEIDHMLNEFYEYDSQVLVRKHAYMEPSVRREEDCTCSDARPQTV